MLTDLDRTRLREALALAETGFGLTEPNPRVGCVIGHSDGRVVGRGATQRAGEAHAEVMALRDAQSAGLDVRGATAWVTLEPCAHHGRTPPCCDALIAAGIGRVVVAIGDPFPQVAGRGLARLRAAGIEVTVADPASEVAVAAHEINIGFFSRVQRGRPWVRMKAAASLDGRTALPNRTSQWITGEAARRDGHAWRRRAGAVLTGIGTVRDDDPRLDVRLVDCARQPRRVVIDSRLEIALTARILDPPGQVCVYAASADHMAQARLEARGTDVRMRPGIDGKVDLPAVMADLAATGVNEVHVEAGAKLNASLLRANVVDELLVYVAPMLIGPGMGIVDLPERHRLDDVRRWSWTHVETVGDDLRLRLRSRTSSSMPSA